MIPNAGMSMPIAKDTDMSTSSKKLSPADRLRLVGTEFILLSVLQ